MDGDPDPEILASASGRLVIIMNLNHSVTLKSDHDTEDIKFLVAIALDVLKHLGKDDKEA